MNTQRLRSSARKQTGRVVKILLAGVIFVGLFFWIGMLAQISGQSKEIATVTKDMVDLRARSENLALSLSMLENPERIETLALQLGMERPDESAIRVVSLPIANEALAQTAELIGAEGVVQ